jgi:hypothetical protein
MTVKSETPAKSDICKLLNQLTRAKAVFQQRTVKDYLTDQPHSNSPEAKT